MKKKTVFKQLPSSLPVLEIMHAQDEVSIVQKKGYVKGHGQVVTSVPEKISSRSIILNLARASLLMQHKRCCSTNGNQDHTHHGFCPQKVRVCVNCTFCRDGRRPMLPPKEAICELARVEFWCQFLVATSSTDVENGCINVIMQTFH